MAIVMGSLGAVSASVLGDDQTMGRRSLELPSIVPTADGLVGFCTITAQQFQDFLVLIERPDLIDDADLASMPGRIKRRDEFLAMVHDWAADKTTDEIIDLATAFRIPVTPIATPQTIPSIDHFVERGVFVESEGGAVVAAGPLPQRRTSGPRSRRAARAGGRHRARWPGALRDSCTATRGERGCGCTNATAICRWPALRVADFTAFWAGPLATQVLAALGADVIKVEGVRRPDGMRFAGGRPPSWDQWWEWGPVFLCTNTNKRDVVLELGTPQGRQAALDLIAISDLVVENFSPRVMGNFDLGWDVVHAVNPRATMVRMPAFGLDGPWRDRVGFAQTMEQASGMAWMTGAADGPPLIPRGVCDPLAGLHAAFAAIAALEISDRTGTGLHVESTMVEAALNVAAEAVLEYSRNGVELRRDGNRGPGASPQGVFPCAEYDEWVALAVLDDDTWPAFAAMIGQPGLAADPALRDEAGRRKRVDEIDKLIADWTATRSADEVVALARERRIGCRRSQAVVVDTRRRTPCGTGLLGGRRSSGRRDLQDHGPTVHDGGSRAQVDHDARAGVRTAHRRGAHRAARQVAGRHRRTGGGRRHQPPACGPVSERPSAHTLRLDSFATRLRPAAGGRAAARRRHRGAGAARRGDVPQPDGIGIHYLEWPGATTDLAIIFLHGGGLHAHTFDLAGNLLRHHARCIGLDLRGHGESEPSPDWYGSEETADDLSSAVEQPGTRKSRTRRTFDGWHRRDHLGRPPAHRSWRAWSSSTSGPELKNPTTASINDSITSRPTFADLEEVESLRRRRSVGRGQHGGEPAVGRRRAPGVQVRRCAVQRE